MECTANVVTESLPNFDLTCMEFKDFDNERFWMVLDSCGHHACWMVRTFSVFAFHCKTHLWSKMGTPKLAVGGGGGGTGLGVVWWVSPLLAINKGCPDGNTPQLAGVTEGAWPALSAAARPCHLLHHQPNGRVAAGGWWKNQQPWIRAKQLPY